MHGDLGAGLPRVGVSGTDNASGSPIHWPMIMENAWQVCPGQGSRRRKNQVAKVRKNCYFLQVNNRVQCTFTAGSGLVGPPAISPLLTGYMGSHG